MSVRKARVADEHYIFQDSGGDLFIEWNNNRLRLSLTDADALTLGVASRKHLEESATETQRKLKRVKGELP